MKNKLNIKDTVSLLILWMDLVFNLLQKQKVWHREGTMHRDVLVLAILAQRVFGRIRAKQNQTQLILSFCKNLTKTKNKKTSPINVPASDSDVSD